MGHLSTPMTHLNEKCHSLEGLSGGGGPLPSAIMFGLGVFGNVTALVILEIRRRRARNTQRIGLFHILVMLLVLTDLAGTCLTSPIVQLSYAWNVTLVKMMPVDNSTSHVCHYFGISMTFFSLSTMLLLFAMALDKCFAIGYPYLYSRHVTKKWVYVTVPVMFLICTLFCLLPFVKFGKYVQYCPGTWCFIDMNPNEQDDRVYANLYATIMLVLVLTIVACNGFVVYHLYKMYKRRSRHGSVMVTTRSSSERRTISMNAEVEHLISLVFMTIIFIICTLPLVIRVYINSVQADVTKESHDMDLTALYFISVNPIVDPLVFIIFSPGVLHFMGLSFKVPLGSVRGSVCRSSYTKRNDSAQLELSYPTLCKEFQSEEKK
ncbi:prostaglandin E receptor 2a (subtype EP2) [Kryptolebias marmoratus]|uniref:Prostaglandin E2 receptor EP2 subtype n=1 Tax=Kryptolebias marmoratus TaxID=37003 RepID=A0A3Q2ZSM1_KRYMA|nr:prostaglandin E receptor 2a (subtype EP2) [Kryptolebias marmoratus]